MSSSEILFAVERFYQSINSLDTLKCFQTEETVNSLGDRRTHVTKIVDVLIHVISVNEDRLLSKTLSFNY